MAKNLPSETSGASRTASFAIGSDGVLYYAAGGGLTDREWKELGDVSVWHQEIKAGTVLPIVGPEHGIESVLTVTIIEQSLVDIVIRNNIKM